MFAVLLIILILLIFCWRPKPTVHDGIRVTAQGRCTATDRTKTLRRLIRIRDKLAPAAIPRREILETASEEEPEHVSGRELLMAELNSAINALQSGLVDSVDLSRFESELKLQAPQLADAPIDIDDPCIRPVITPERREALSRIMTISAPMGDSESGY